MRAVLDTNVLVSASISPSGAPAALVRRWLAGEFELVISPALLGELRRVLAYPKLASMISGDEGDAIIDALRLHAIEIADPEGPPPVRATDSDDDYLIALAATAGAALVSGDTALLDLSNDLPVFTPAEFRTRLDAAESASPGS